MVNKANSIAIFFNKKIVATFLTAIGSKTYDLLMDIVAPTKPSELKFVEILAALNEHYDPKPLVIAERFNFHKRNPLPDESIAEYCAAFRKHASTCEFGTFLDEALRDRLVCGMRDVATQRRLLVESKLTLTKALEIAQGMAAASKQAQQFKSESTEQPGESINFQSKKPKRAKEPGTVIVVVKPDGSIRICGDDKVTVNQYLEVEKHPLPKAEDLFVELSGGEKFSKLDLKNAYNQIILDETFREYVTINTHKGLFRPTRLPYGVAPASAIFQSKMEQLLHGIPMVVCRVDNILISGKDDASHMAHLNEVLSQLHAANLHLRLDKCKFLQTSAEHLGYLINAQGLHTTDRKVAAIAAAPAPRNVQQLRSFLGMLNYYSKFIKNYSMTAFAKKG